MGTHTSSGEWQSFEVRMRYRRADRLLLRAEAAAEAGFVEEARAALDEARSLAPRVEGLEDVQARVDAAALRRVPETPTARARGRRAVLVGGVVTLVIASAAAGTWLARLERATLPPPSLHGVDTLLASPPALPIPLRVETEAVDPGQLSVFQSKLDDRSSLDGRGQTPPLTATSGSSSPSVPLTPVAVPATQNDGGQISILQSKTEDRDLTPTPGVPVEEPAPPAVAAPPAAVEPAVNDTSLVRGVLDQYASAYSRLDVNAAAAAWPRVNRSALARAFDGLASQHVTLESCDVTVRGASSRATCHGTTAWRPKVGGGEHTDPRTWTFDLAKAPGGWQIVDARVQNR